MIFGIDIETDWTPDNKRTWIVCGEISGGEWFRRSFDDVDGFFDILAEMAKMVNITFCAHNLKFEMAFLSPDLYWWAKNNGYKAEVIARKKNPIQVTLTSENNHKRKISFIDSLKKYPAKSVEALGEMLGMPKLDHPEFTAGWWARLNNGEKKQVREYCRRDAEISRRAILAAHERKLTAITIGGDCWRDFQRTHGAMFRERFAKLPRALDLKLRTAAAGGINFSRPGYYLGHLEHWDIQSSYPAQAVMREMPYGDPILTDVDRLRDDDLFIVTNVGLKLDLRHGHHAWYRFRSGLDAKIEGMRVEDPVKKTWLMHWVGLTSVDLAELEKDYRVTIEECEDTEYYGFRRKKGLFAEYYNKWFAEKTSHRGKRTTVERGQYEQDKYLCNGLTGKLGQGTVFDDCYLGPAGISGEGEIVKDVANGYVPAYAFITAYGRAALLEGARMVRPRDLIHGDTDSIFCRGSGPEDLIGDQIGDWDREQSPVEIYERGYKRYCQIWGDGTADLTCAGLPHCSARDLRGPGIEIVDDPSIFLRDRLKVGRAEYRPREQWIRDRVGDVVDTLRLIPRPAIGGVVLCREQFDLTELAIKMKIEMTQMEMMEREDLIDVERTIY